MRWQVKATAAVTVLAGVGLLLLLAAAVLGAGRAYDGMLALSSQSRLSLALEAIDARRPGPWSLRGGKLYKGEADLANDTDLIDNLASLSRGTVTLYAGSNIFLTSAKDAAGKRVTSGMADASVTAPVLEDGTAFTDKAPQGGLIGSYLPLKDATGRPVGMAYLGLSPALAAPIETGYTISLFLVALILLFIVFAVAYYLAGRALVPLRETRKALASLAAGNLRGEDIAEPPGEFGTLAHAANQLKARLDGFLQNVTNASHAVIHASDELAESTEATLKALGAPLAKPDGSPPERTTADLAEDAQALAEKLAALSDTIEEVRQLATQSAELAEGKPAGATSAQPGSKADKGTGSATTASDALKELSATAESVQNITAAIAELAQQMNRLSLRAALEGARLGGEGQDFVAVAQEVRKLSSETVLATEEIKDKLQTIAPATESVSTALKTAAEESRQKERVAEAKQEAIQQLAENTATLRTTITKAAASLEETTADAGRTKEALSTLAAYEEATQKAATSLRESPTSQTSLKDLAKTSKSLRDLAQKLDYEVGRFQID